ncbi:MAG: hypothetical protein H0X13_09290 [Ramlibacter sp.]|nr:hypothetical protein [Ramlibacter sp.]
MNREFFVVSEGTTDFEVLKALILNSGLASGGRYRARALWPADRNAQKAGWSSMKNWCKEQASALTGNDRRILAASLLNPKPTESTIRKPAVADKIGAALSITAAGHERRLILQIDADVAHHLIGECVANQAFTLPLSIAERRTVCENALKDWLGGHAQKIGAGILLCVPTVALETWILATHDQAELHAKCNVPMVIGDYDHLMNPDKLLVKLGYAGHGSGAQRELRKTVGHYVTYGERIVARFEDCRARSMSFDSFCISLAA